MNASGKLRRDDGFTLVEMIVVLLLVALGGAVLTVNIRPQQQAIGAEMFARHVARQARHAASMAITSGKATAFALDLGSRETSVDDDAEPVRLLPAVPLSMTVAEQLIEDMRMGRIVFYPDGSSSGGEVRIGGGNQPGFVVRIFWLTGTVSLERQP